MEKLNIAELLKGCPTDMELDCTMYNKVTLVNVDNKEDNPYPIKIKLETGCCIILTKYGQYTDADFAKCVIYPKGKTTWEGFQRPFKDGDIVAFDNPYRERLEIFIFKDKKENNTLSTCYLMLDGDELYLEEGMYYITRLATEEEKEKLFNAIKDSGYKWNAETKTLEKLIKPKFKLGDNIRTKDTSAIYGVTEVREDCYILDDKDIYLTFKNQDEWELAPDKFDITTLKPFESRVLVRNVDGDLWKPAIYGLTPSKGGCYVVGGVYWKQFIPYKDNKHLLGTTNDCNDYYKNWK
jgi:hypothetical protein